MKALAYQKAHAIDSFAIREMVVAEPTLRNTDLLVDIRAVGINPGEAYIRSVRSADDGGRVILGWEFAGVVIGIGPATDGFALGDRVFGTGDVTRDGGWSERLVVDYRVVAKLPDQVSFVDAASLAIGGVTAWEAIFRDQDTLPAGVERVLVIGGAGGVGSMAIQLLKARTGAFVIATASRPESAQWCKTMGADLVIDHAQDVAEQLGAAGIDHVDMVFSTAGTANNLHWIGELLRPYGHLSAIDIAAPFDASPLVSKSASLHTEMVFARIINGFDVRTQAKILDELARHVVTGRIRSIMTERIDGLTAAHMKTAHERLESRRTIGKIVIAA